MLRRVFHRTPWVFSVLPLFVLWEIIGRMDLYLFVPSLTEIFKAGMGLVTSGRMYENGIFTVYLLVKGFILSIGLGVLLGILMGRYSLAEAFFGIYVDLFQSAPASALVPVLILIFGLGPGSIVATVFIFTFFIVVVNVYTGVRGVNPRLLEMARSYGFSEWMTLRRVILPAAMPMILAGFRMGVGRAYNGVVLGEMLISIVGIGGLLMIFGSSFKMDRLFAMLFVIVVLASLSMAGVQKLEKRLLRWME
ncbi:MAG: ABC transporter permease [Firmicutes bacterium]|nr:ABC transporter permease [Bacillota bacterium]